MKNTVFAFLTAALLMAEHARAISDDADTLLLLHFNGNANGAASETPTTNTGLTYAAGVTGQGAQINSPAQLYYAASGNFDPTRGSLECWIKPTWAGNDGQGHTILRHGSGGGVLIVKDGANNLRGIFNRFAANGQPEVGVGFNIASWTANTWHHVALTWGDGALRIYTDSVLRATTAVGALPTVATATFQIGADNTGTYATALLDEMRISSRPRTAAEIAAGYIEDIPGVTSIGVIPASATIWPTWSTTPVVQAVTALGTITVPPTAVSWTNPAPAVVQVGAQGQLTALAGGVANLTAGFRGQTAPFTFTVQTPALPPEEIAIAPELSTPMANALNDMPVVVISYLPTSDGVNMDTAESGGEGGLNTVVAAKSKIAGMNRDVKFSLSEGSRYHGYQNAAARPSLGYRVVKNIIVYEPLPPGKSAGGSANFADFNQILARFGGGDWVNGQSVREIWLWGYHTAKIVPVESNMSSPTTGDVSNSNRFADDLPIYDRTYVLYNYNYGRSQNEAVHNHGHQLESIFSYIAQRQDGNDSLFWDRFCGRSGGVFQQGRCGNTHNPPNSTGDYDYYNNTPVLSDCEDWRPDNSGQKKNVSAQTWGGLSYAWPSGPPGGNTEAQFYIYWMQNMPGHQNGVRMNSEVMRNWWEFTADWDAAIRKNSGLHKTAEAAIGPVGWNPANGRFQVRVTGDAGFAFAVESTSDFSGWNPLNTGANFPGGLTVEDPSSPGALRRYYRARIGP